ncbi:MAG: hypothetical protein ACUVRY_01185 [Thermoanaerobaculaceae bacterium]
MAEMAPLLAHLEQVRQAGIELLRTRLDGLARQLQDMTSRLIADLDVVLPANPEVLFPLDGLEALLPKPAPQVRALDLDTLRHLDAGRAQSAVLQGLLQATEPFSGGRAILVFREGQIFGWSGLGFSPESVRRWRSTVDASPALKKVAGGTPVLLRAQDDPVLSEFLRNPGATVVVVPMSLRGNVVGAFLAEEGENGLWVEWIQFYTYVVGLLLETLAVRTVVPTPAVAPVEDLRSFSAPAPVAEVPSGAVFTPTESVPVHEVGVPGGAGEVPPASEAALEVQVTPAEAPKEVSVTQDEVSPETSSMAGPRGAEFDALATQRLEVSPVAPPRTPEEQRKHEEAKRFARLLVSEIRLYNEQAVQEGKANRDLYARLKEDIDRSREMYEQRIPAEVRSVSDYFYEELVRTLADGDPDALGL